MKKNNINPLIIRNFEIIHANLNIIHYKQDSNNGFVNFISGRSSREIKDKLDFYSHPDIIDILKRDIEAHKRYTITLAKRYVGMLSPSYDYFIDGIFKPEENLFKQYRIYLYVKEDLKKIYQEIWAEI